MNPMPLFRLLLPLLLFSASLLQAGTQTLGDSVVAIKTYNTESRQQLIGDYQGFVFEAEGFILTSYRSLINPANEQLLSVIDVHLPGDSNRYAATIVGVEPTINLAIIKIFADQPLQPVTPADINSKVPGEALSAVRLANGKLHTVSGRLAGLNTRECYQESMTSTMFRAEIPLNDTHLGSPIFDLEGNVVAIYTGYKPPVVEGHRENPREIHLLPIQLAMNIYDSLKFKKSMKSPWTGFSVIPLNQQQQALFPTEKGDKGGIALEYVWKDSPADKLGIKPGDILTRFGHYRILSPADFQKWLYMYGVGHEVKMVLLRDGDYQVHTYTIEERPQWAIPK